MSAVSHSGHVCCATQQTCLLCRMDETQGSARLSNKAGDSAVGVADSSSSSAGGGYDENSDAIRATVSTGSSGIADTDLHMYIYIYIYTTGHMRARAFVPQPGRYPGTGEDFFLCWQPF